MQHVDGHERVRRNRSPGEEAVLVVAMQIQWVGGKCQWVGGKCQWVGGKCQWVAVSAVGPKMTAVRKAGVVDCTGTAGEEDSGLASLR